VTLAEFNIKLESISAKIPAIVQTSLEGGTERLYAEMANRIFNEHLTSGGASFGTYESEAYAELRKSVGRQGTVKDLEVYGNLRKSMGVNLEKRAVIVDTGIKVKSIPTKKEKKVRLADPWLVMQGQQEQIVGKQFTGIFDASEKEVNTAMEVVSSIWAELITEEINKA